MRIRPFFWCLLATVCVGILVFAANYHMHAPNVLQVRIQQQHIVAAKPAMLELFLTDTQGLPIESAEICSHAYMTNMAMPTREISIKALGQGYYSIQLHLYMTGPWAITVQAQAEGFIPSQQNLHVQVE